MSDNLERLILTIEARLAAIDEAFGPAAGLSGAKAYEQWKARQSAYRGVIDDLVSMECAKYTMVSDAHTLKLAGIRTSCTGGEHGLLTAWVRRARAQIEAGKAVA